MALPDGPKTPGWLQTLQWNVDCIEYAKSASQRYGDIFTGRFWFNAQPAVVVGSSQAVEQIFTKLTKDFDPFIGESRDLIRPLVGDYSLLTLQDQNNYQRHRKLLMPHFHGERLQSYGQKICQVAEEVMQDVAPGTSFDACEVIGAISMESIFRVVFGLEKGNTSSRLKQLFMDLLDYITTPGKGIFMYLPFLQKDLGAWSPWGYYKRVKAEIDQVLYQEITKRRQNLDPERNDILSMLLSAHDEAGQPMTDEEIHSELLTFLTSGYKPIAMATAWALYWVHYVPQVRSQLIEQLSYLGENPESMSLAQQPYLKAVCQETMRINPIVPIISPQRVKSQVELMGYQLEPGTIVIPCNYLIHHREDLYPEHDKFKPERFLEREYSAYEYVPFGPGMRRCLGSEFAYFEMKLVLGTILSRYDLELVEPRPLQPKVKGFVVAPAGGVQMVMNGQRQAQPLAAEALIN
ncbi:MAG: cytochrome P450 [Planktothrix agardhii KL2]|jgi:cytochrome P450|uniref:cytochrome P450 n=1 Tax=Planktothrix agardhii TaxID=1160 RepID=UPI001A20EED0|nr:cytochrome P450 [Planktothrix agardhii]MBG0749237.1 cytochrome P450 [Planktothrix agardhii KL2]MCB8788856.1 cytochrome P450 [Planktothrix agardhii 1025]MCF3614117.1 cytochrome P450 [Planktothrix agardhii 1027]MCF3647772.1 cytochrome P450 [Planktothrix agardhii 1026]MDS1348529.1 cytochrome P450 [Planktothrix agardhii NRERC-751]